MNLDLLKLSLSYLLKHPICKIFFLYFYFSASLGYYEIAAKNNNNDNVNLAKTVSAANFPTNNFRYFDPNPTAQDSATELKNYFIQTAQEFVRLKHWKEAINSYNQLAKFFPDEQSKVEKIIQILQKPKLDVKVFNLGTGVNSEFQEYYPVISADGKSLFFTSRYRDGGMGGEDVWVSVKTLTGWTNAVNVGTPINTDQHEGFMNISPDSTIAFIFGNYPDSYGNGDIYFTNLTASGWSEVKNLGLPINSKHFEADACLSSDGKTLFFVSDRPGGVGEYKPKNKFHHPYFNTDIYISVRDEFGWSEPLNIGNIINTPECERGPIFHPDGETLFFCSSGHPGLGDLDIFVSHKIGNSWTDWTTPVNIGKEINTIYKDWGYSIPASGDAVYFASMREKGYGLSDIYIMQLPERLTRPVTIVSGKVTDTKGSPLTDVKIVWEDLQTFKELGITSTRPSGDYTILLPSGKWYGYTATKDSFLFSSRDVDLRKNEISDVNLPIELPKATPQDLAYSSALLNLFFEINQSTLRSESLSELKRFTQLIRAHPEWSKVEISGHTCDLGSNEYNKKLSYERAKAVVNFITNQGISPTRLFAKGYGYERPLVSGVTDEARIKNRRVEFRVIELQNIPK